MSSLSEEQKMQKTGKGRYEREQQLPNLQEAICQVDQNIRFAFKKRWQENSQNKKDKPSDKSRRVNCGFNMVLQSKLLFTCLTFLEFSNLLSLILIQYIFVIIIIIISSNVQLAIFLIIIIPVILLHLILIAITTRIQLPALEVGSRRSLEKQEQLWHYIIYKKEEQISTLPKINEQIRKVSIAKTKKLKYPSSKGQEEEKTEQVIKKQSSEGKQLGIKDENPEKYLHSKTSALLLAKIFQMVLEIVQPSLCLTVFHPSDNELALVVIALSTVAFVLFGVSLAAFFAFIKGIRCSFEAKVIYERGGQQNREEQSEHYEQVKSKVSIDQLLQAKSGEIRSALSIDKEAKSIKCEKDAFKPELYNAPEAIVRKLQIKKSVLKSSKNRELNPKNSEKEMVERRKVEINSKKIEYFQYPQIVPSRSAIEDQEVNTHRPEKSKLNEKRLKYIRQRMDSQAKILGRKIIARETKAKSLCSLGRQRDFGYEKQFKKTDFFC